MTRHTLQEKDGHMLCFVMTVVVPRQCVSTKRTQSSMGGLVIGKPVAVVIKVENCFPSSSISKLLFAKAQVQIWTFPSWDSHWELQFGPILPIDRLLGGLDVLHAEVHHVACQGDHQDRILHPLVVQKH